MTTAQPSLYRIAWKSRLTSATGHGTGAYPKDEAQRIADDLNRDSEPGALAFHWIEPVSAEAQR